MKRRILRLNKLKIYWHIVRSSKPLQERFNSFLILMNLFFSKPYTLLFSSTLTLGVIFAITSNNWLSIWIGLELNLYSFIPLLLQSSLNQEKEAAIKYFLVQALASAILLLRVLILNLNSITSIFIVLAIIIKLGIAPCHFWLPSVINSLSWIICWVLATVQKIAPILLLTQILTSISTLTTSSLAILRAIIGAIGGLNQTQIRAILAYSSIGHIGWIISSTLISPLMTFIYFISYIIIISRIIQPLHSTISYSANFLPSHSLNSKLIKNSFLINLLRLGGLPPLFGFFPKILLLISLLHINLLLLCFVLIISSTINLYYYLKIISSIFFNLPQQLLLTSPPKSILILIFTALLRTFIGLLLIFLII